MYSEPNINMHARKLHGLGSVAHNEAGAEVVCDQVQCIVGPEYRIEMVLVVGFRSFAPMVRLDSLAKSMKFDRLIAACRAWCYADERIRPGTSSPNPPVRATELMHISLQRRLVDSREVQRAIEDEKLPIVRNKALVVHPGNPKWTKRGAIRNTLIEELAPSRYLNDG